MTTTTTDYAYDDGLHPPAIVHIPEEYIPDDPTSPGNIESPLSSPPNSPNAWDQDDLGGEEEDDEVEEDHEDGGAGGIHGPTLSTIRTTTTTTNTDSLGLPLAIPALNHNNVTATDVKPFDEGVNQYNSKILALNSIRDERMQRKMRRRQHVWSDQHNSVELQQRMNQQQQQEHQTDLEKLEEEDQPFDLQQNAETGIKPAPQKVIIITHVVEEPEAPEEQPFDAHPQHNNVPTGPEQIAQTIRQEEREQQPIDEPFDASDSQNASLTTARGEILESRDIKDPPYWMNDENQQVSHERRQVQEQQHPIDKALADTSDARNISMTTSQDLYRDHHRLNELSHNHNISRPNEPSSQRNALHQFTSHHHLDDDSLSRPKELPSLSYAQPPAKYHDPDRPKSEIGVTLLGSSASSALTGSSASAFTSTLKRRIQRHKESSLNPQAIETTTPFVSAPAPSPSSTTAASRTTPSRTTRQSIVPNLAVVRTPPFVRNTRTINNDALNRSLSEHSFSPKDGRTRVHQEVQQEGSSSEDMRIGSEVRERSHSASSIASTLRENNPSQLPFEDELMGREDRSEPLVERTNSTQEALRVENVPDDERRAISTTNARSDKYTGGFEDPITVERPSNNRPSHTLRPVSGSSEHRRSVPSNTPPRSPRVELQEQQKSHHSSGTETKRPQDNQRQRSNRIDDPSPEEPAAIRPAYYNSSVLDSRPSLATETVTLKPTQPYPVEPQSNPYSSGDRRSSSYVVDQSSHPPRRAATSPTNESPFVQRSLQVKKANQMAKSGTEREEKKWEEEGPVSLDKQSEFNHRQHYNREAKNEALRWGTPNDPPRTWPLSGGAHTAEVIQEDRNGPRSFSQSTTPPHRRLHTDRFGAIDRPSNRSLSPLQTHRPSNTDMSMEEDRNYMRSLSPCRTKPHRMAKDDVCDEERSSNDVRSLSPPKIQSDGGSAGRNRSERPDSPSNKQLPRPHRAYTHDSAEEVGRDMRSLSPPIRQPNRRAHTDGSIHAEVKGLPDQKGTSSAFRQHNAASPSLTDPINKASSADSALDDDASWLAQRLSARDQHSQKGENSSWLVERFGQTDRKSIDEDASWLAGRLGRTIETEKKTSARGRSDAPGTTPLNPSTKDSSTSTSRARRANAKKNTSSPAHLMPFDRPIQEESNVDLDSSFSHRSALSEDLNPPSMQNLYTSHPMRRINSDIAGSNIARNRQSRDRGNSGLSENRATSSDGTGTGRTDSNTSRGSAGVGSLIESIDEMVKDLEITFTPEKGSRTHAKINSAHSEQKIGTISTSFQPELETGPTASLNRDSKGKPVLLQQINNDAGIPKGDIIISLLSENMDTPWSARIEEAVWRCRTMRQHCDTKWLRQKLERQLQPNTPSNGRTSVLVDVDEVRVVGGIDSVAASQKSALEHLKYDDLDDALALYEDIVEAYYSHFENCLQKNTTVEELDDQVATFSTYIASCLHNIGVVYLLLKKPKEAYSHFERAATKRAATLGVGHTDHLASNVKAATCQIALGRHNEAVKMLEECLILLKEGGRSISDQRQVAEIYNNLACLYYSMGNHEKASSYFLESFEAQTVALEHSLYAGARFSCHSATLNLAVTRSNIGFLALVSRNHEVAIECLEYGVHNQQLLLRDAHTTLIATIDHLVVAQIFAGNKDKAIRLLRRMYHMQNDAFGSSDDRCLGTAKKLAMLEDTGPQSFDSQQSDDQLESLDGSSSNTSDRKKPNIFRLLKSMTKK
ncbi:hypothetical protein ACA910_003122 [Epithemia clementina (nom. ined.)]